MTNLMGLYSGGGLYTRDLYSGEETLQFADCQSVKLITFLSFFKILL